MTLEIDQIRRLVTNCEVSRKQSSNAMRITFWGVLAFSLVLWIAFWWVAAPIQAGRDVFVYKDAGCNLALGRGFYSIGLPGTDDLQPHLFASNGPAVPFLFGLTRFSSCCLL